MMKRILAMALLAVSLLAGAAEKMGIFSQDTQSYLVRGKGYSFLFFEGHMFPRRFTLDKAGEMCTVRNQDFIRYKNRTYYLNLDRWTKHRIISNTSQEFIIEFEGKFCCNERPLADHLKFVTAIYRYTFKYDVPGFHVAGRLVKAPDFKETIRLPQTLNFTWAENFVTQVKRGDRGGFEAVKRNKYYDVPQKGLTFAGKQFSVTIRGRRSIGIVEPKGWMSKVMMNAGLWSYDWKTPEVRYEAQLLLGEGK